MKDIFVPSMSIRVEWCGSRLIGITLPTAPPPSMALLRTPQGTKIVFVFSTTPHQKSCQFIFERQVDEHGIFGQTIVTY